MSILDLNKNQDESINSIKWNKIFSIFKRRKIFIISGVCAGIFLGGLYLLIKKPLWEGEFQIVVSNKDESKIQSALMNTLGLAKYAGIDTGSNKLETEVNQYKLKTSMKLLSELVPEWKMK